MPSSTVPDEVWEAARALSPHPVRAVSELGSGNNSRVFKIDTASHAFALKKYPKTDDRDRLGAEVAAVRFFERNRIERTPRLVATEPVARFGLFTWLEGSPVSELSESEIVEFAAFQIALDEAVDEAARAGIGEASEACLSGARIVAQVERRFGRLAPVAQDLPAFRPLFEGVLAPSLVAFEASARNAYGALDLSFDDDVPRSWRTLIPSDMGSHNALRGLDGRLLFLDFEYFGWDDPVTSIANFVLHPGMQLSPDLERTFEGHLVRHFRRSREADRLAALVPLFVLRWCAIILGELLPERWSHRTESNAQFRDWDQVRNEQIAKARALIGRFLP